MHIMLLCLTVMGGGGGGAEELNLKEKVQICSKCTELNQFQTQGTCPSSFCPSLKRKHMFSARRLPKVVKTAEGCQDG